MEKVIEGCITAVLLPPFLLLILFIQLKTLLFGPEQPAAPVAPPPQPDAPLPASEPSTPLSRADDWWTAAIERDLFKRDEMAKSLVDTLTAADVDVLVTMTERQAPGFDLAHEVLYRLLYENDPRLAGTEAVTRWNRVLRDEFSKRFNDVWYRPDVLLPRDVRRRRPNVNGLLPLDRRQRAPLWGGGHLELGPGDVPCSISVGNAVRIEAGDDSDRIQLDVIVPGDDGAVYKLDTEIDLTYMFLALEVTGERDDRRAGELLAERLAIRFDDRSTARFAATCAGKVLDVNIYKKYLRVRCDLIALPADVDDTGTTKPDRLGMRVDAHSYAGRIEGSFGSMPTPRLQYAYRSIAPLLFPDLPPSHGPRPQPYFEVCSWIKDQSGFLPGPKARVVRD